MSLAVKHFCLAISSEDEPWYSGTSRFINGSCSIQIGDTYNPMTWMSNSNLYH